MSEEHQHDFKARYRRVDGGIVVDNPCRCTKCDQLAFVEMEGYKIIVTLIPQHPQITYTVDVVEDSKS